MFQKIGTSLYDESHRVLGRVIGYRTTATGKRVYVIQAYKDMFGKPLPCDGKWQLLAHPESTRYMPDIGEPWQPWEDFEGWTEKEGIKMFGSAR